MFGNIVLGSPAVGERVVKSVVGERVVGTSF